MKDVPRAASRIAAPVALAASIRIDRELHSRLGIEQKTGDPVEWRAAIALLHSNVFVPFQFWS
jgi:hypothetical protein